MAPQASKKCSLLLPAHQQFGCWTSNSINLEQAPGTFLVLTISSLTLQLPVQSRKKLLTLFAPSDGSVETRPCIRRHEEDMTVN